VSLTYSDVHRVRARFFVSLFADLGDVVWSEPVADRAEGLADGASFTLVTGALESRDRDRRETFLEAIGAALVFLIDWNKARKQLRLFVAKEDAIAVLRWAARASLGHRAFLEHGGARLDRRRHPPRRQPPHRLRRPAGVTIMSAVLSGRDDVSRGRRVAELGHRSAARPHRATLDIVAMSSLHM